MKKALSIILITLLVVLSFCACLETDTEHDQGTASADTKSNLSNYGIVIESCRLAEDYSGKPVVIVKYKFTNNDKDPTSFMWTLEDKAFQDGVGLNKSYILDDSANYSSDNQTKEIKQGASIYVEVAYELNDTTSDVEIEVSELISFSDKKITKKFTIK